MTSIPGVDYAWSHPGGSALRTAGKQFACRYLSPDSSKNITKTEANDLAAHGVWAVVVWESTANRALGGKAAGVADAKTAAIQATAAGMPSSRPIYFAVDFDATEGQQTAINAYLDGAASVIGRGRVGIYGGYYPVKRALDAGKATWAWQTIAWSGGQWDPRAVIRQGAQKTIGGVSCDLNTAVAADYGQWMPGKTPNVEDDVALTSSDISKIADAVFAKISASGGVLKNSDLDRIWQRDIIPAAQPPYNNSDYFKADGKTPDNTTWSATYTQYTQVMGIREILDLVKKLQDTSAPQLTDAQVTALAQQVAASTSLVDLIAAKVAENIAARMAQ